MAAILGDARSSSFILSSGTLMLGACNNDTGSYKLTRTSHSVGLVKNLKVTADAKFQELTQGIRNSLVYSVQVGLGLEITADLYEYTLQNLLRCVSYNGASTTGLSRFKLTSATDIHAGADASGSSAAIAATNTATITFNSGATDYTLINPAEKRYVAGNWVYLFDDVSGEVWTGKILTASYSSPTMSLTLDVTNYPMNKRGNAGSGVTSNWLAKSAVDGGYRRAGPIFTAGNTYIGRLHTYGTELLAQEASYLSAKIVGMMPKNNRPIVMVFPKVRITGGMKIDFKTTDYSAMPIKLTPYSCDPDDDHYETFGKVQMHLFGMA